MRNRLHIFNNSKGQTIVEFSLVVTLLLAILFGIAEFGRAWFYSNQLTNAVRAAARYGAVYPAPNNATLRTAVRTYLRGEIALFMDPNNIDGPPDVEIIDIPGGDSNKPQRGDTIRVTVAYNFRFLVGSYFIENIFHKDTSWRLVRSASMQYELTQ